MQTRLWKININILYKKYYKLSPVLEMLFIILFYTPNKTRFKLYLVDYVQNRSPAFIKLYVIGRATNIKVLIPRACSRYIRCIYYIRARAYTYNNRLNANRYLKCSFLKVFCVFEHIIILSSRKFKRHWKLFNLPSPYNILFLLLISRII